MTLLEILERMFWGGTRNEVARFLYGSGDPDEHGFYVPFPEDECLFAWG
jgi:hypothetical protein